MSAPTLCNFLDKLTQSLNASAVWDLSDKELVGRVASSRDHSAFQVLVARHGAMVYGVCRRLLRREQDVEDAFQATFFVLARKAGSIVKGEALVGWLYQVACRVARQSTKVLQRRSMQSLPDEDQLVDHRSHEPNGADDARLIVEEIDRLPAKYRTVMILCCLQGITHDEAAKRVGCPTGTISVRLMRARKKLSERLSRRGIAVSVGSLFALLSTQSSFANQVSLHSSTTKAALDFAAGIQAGAGSGKTAALALAKGVLQTMTWNRIKWTLITPVSILALVIVLGIGAMASQTAPTDRPIAEKKPIANDPQEKRQNDKPKLSAHAVGIGFVNALFSDFDSRKAAEFAYKKGERQGAVANRPLQAWVKQLKAEEFDRVRLKEMVFFKSDEFALVKGRYAGPRPDRMWDRIQPKLKGALACLVIIDELEQNGQDRHMFVLIIREIEGQNRIVYLDDD